MKKTIELSSGFKMVYQKPEDYYPYYHIYHGQKYNDDFFRKSPEVMTGYSEYWDFGYLIYDGDTVVGGVLLSPNFMCDLFVVAPFDRYEDLLKLVTEAFIKISDPQKPLIVREIVEDHLAFYQSAGYNVAGSTYWMTRPALKLNTPVCEGYELKRLIKEDVEEAAGVIKSAYEHNPVFETVGSIDDYKRHIEAVFDLVENKRSLYEASAVMVEKTTGKLVGTCFNMEFDQLPLIMSLAVLPEHQGKGIGQALLSNAISQVSADYGATRLSVDRNNKALKTYERMGFIKNRPVYDMQLNL